VMETSPWTRTRGRLRDDYESNLEQSCSVNELGRSEFLREIMLIQRQAVFPGRF
jgi:hypothetical protein